jgi:predicted DNA-binding transcriptional regulator YafY
VKPDGSPTSRALLTLELLQESPGLRAEVLARRLGVTDRAARRYVGILREAGIPVISERGPYGGYRLGRGLRLPPLVFSSTEALGLVMAVLDGHHAAADSDDPVGSALGKLMRSLPQDVADQAAAVRRHAAPAPDRAAVRPDPATTSALVQAIAAKRRVSIDYRTEGGSEWTTTVDPWAVVVRFGRWYLLCHSHAADALRSYRVDRVRGVVELDETFERPDDLDAVALVEENLGSGWEHDARVLIEAPFDELTRLPRELGRLEAVDDRSTRLHGTTSNPYWYAERLATLTVPFRVEGGPELRACVHRLGARLIAATSDADG